MEAPALHPLFENVVPTPVSPYGGPKKILFFIKYFKIAYQSHKLFIKYFDIVYNK
jgi:hypothetical protein